MEMSSKCMYLAIVSHDLKRSLANLPMASNFSFGLVAFSEVSGILVLIAQTISAFPLYPIILG